MSAPLLAADLPWLLYRAHFALPSSVKGADGEPVGALLGAVNTLLQAVDAFAPRAVVACTGPESADYRVERFPAYHADRPAMPAPLAHRWGQAPALCRALGWHVVDGGDHEADDVLGTLALLEEEAGGEALLLTADRDMWQCATERVRVVVPRKGEGFEVSGAAEVEAKAGVPPALVPDLIALRGDPSDGIPGAPGIGAKTAASLLRSCGSLDAVLADPETHAPRFAARLREHADDLRTFKDVATLVRLPLARPADAPTDRAGGAAAARELGMARLAERLEAGVEAPA